MLSGSLGDWDRKERRALAPADRAIEVVEMVSRQSKSVIIQ